MKRYSLNIKLYICFSLFILFSCKSRITKTNSGQIGSSKYFILEADIENDNPIFPNSKQTKLTDKEIIDIEKIIKNKAEQTISEYKKETNNEFNDIDYNYHRQYFAAINNKDEKLVWIFFFCDSDVCESYNLIKEKANISDGGKCFFELKVNLKTKKIIDYKFNFEA